MLDGTNATGVETRLFKAQQSQLIGRICEIHFTAAVIKIDAIELRVMLYLLSESCFLISQECSKTPDASAIFRKAARDSITRAGYWGNLPKERLTFCPNLGTLVAFARCRFR